MTSSKILHDPKEVTFISVVQSSSVENIDTLASLNTCGPLPLRDVKVNRSPILTKQVLRRSGPPSVAADKDGMKKYRLSASSSPGNK